MNEASQLGGELFPADKIPGLVKYLDRRGISVHEGVNGSFDRVRGVMTFPRNPTNLNVRHELSHMLGQEKGSATVLILGNSRIAKIVNWRLPFL